MSHFALVAAIAGAAASGCSYFAVAHCALIAIGSDHAPALSCTAATNGRKTLQKSPPETPP
jgi:hypothetical protein